MLILFDFGMEFIFFYLMYYFEGFFILYIKYFRSQSFIMDFSLHIQKHSERKFYFRETESQWYHIDTIYQVVKN